MTPTVHVLAYGRVLCGSIHGLPCNWGRGHRWVSAFEESWRQNATCAVCREAAGVLATARIEQIVRDVARLLRAGPDDGETE